MHDTHHSQRSAVFSEINITPLTDIFLVLLIIMMVVAPMVHQMRRDIKPPEISGGNDIDQKELSVEVLSDGRCFVEGQETSETDLQAVLASREESSQTKDLIVRADRAARSEAILKVFRAAEAAGFEKVILAGEVRRPSELETESTS